MTERIADPQAVCPFVALEDDRDHRAPVPDHSHRCFAESPAAPRALAHQAAYCLSGSFPTCPTFVDWARREAAPARVESPARSLRDAGPTRPATVPPAERPTSRAGASAGDWTAPPLWGSAAEPAAAGADGDAAPAAAAGTAQPSGPNLFDEAAFAGPADAAIEALDAAPLSEASAARQTPDDTPAFLSGRHARPDPAPPWDDDERPWSARDDAEFDSRDDESARRPVAAPRRMPVGYAPVAPGSSERRAGDSRRDRADAAAPSWEQPRRFEEYPTLKSRGVVGVPRLPMLALVILLVGAGLFATPFLLKGLGGGEDQASPTPAASASVVPTGVPSPTAVPTPAQVVHIVKSGDTISRIAAKYGVTIDQILAANPTITNVNKIAVGAEIAIPQPLPSEIVDGEITPAP
ncbi:MAG: LysM peptidoglycan-binding domain-containing protein [Chloroflexota bacterium]